MNLLLKNLRKKKKNYDNNSKYIKLNAPDKFSKLKYNAQLRLNRLKHRELGILINYFNNFSKLKKEIMNKCSN